jgi:hypothetical protein
VSATDCPTCNRPLPPSVVNGQAQAVVRCEGCQTLLLWSNGRVMRSARATTPTMMGLPVATPGAPKRDADAPLPSLLPEGDSARQVVPPLRPATPIPPGMRPATAPTPVQPSRTPTQPGRAVAPRATMMGLGDPTTPPRREPTPAPPSRTVAPTTSPREPAPAPPSRTVAPTTPVRRDPTPAPPSRTVAPTPSPREPAPAPPSRTVAPTTPARRDPTPAPPSRTAAPTTPASREPVPAPPSRTVAPTTPARRDPTPAPPSRTVAPTTPARRDPTPAPPSRTVAPTTPARRDPTPAPPSLKNSPSQANRLAGATPVAPSPPAPSAAQRVAASGDDKRGVTAAVAEVPKMAGGPMVDPSAWFAESTSDVVPPERLPPLPAGLGVPAPAPFEIEAPNEFDASLTPTSGTIASRAPDPEPKPPEPAPAKRSPTSIRGGTPGVLGAAAKTGAATGKANVPVAMAEPASPSGTTRSGDTTGPANVPTLLPDGSESSGLSSLMQESKTVKGKAAPLPEPAPAARALTELHEPSPRNVVAPAKVAEPSPRNVVAPIDSRRQSAASEVPAARLPEPAPAARPEVASAHAAEPSPSELGVPRQLVSERSVPALPPPPEHAVDGVPRALRDDAAESTRPLVRGAGMPRSQRILAAGAGAFVILVILLSVILRKHGGADDRSSTRPAAPPAVATAPPAVTAVPSPVAPAPVAPVAAEPTAAAPAVAEAPPEAPRSGRSHRTLGGKKVVLEYDPKPTGVTLSAPQAPTPMGEDPNVVSRAREAYHRGNNKLFAGDTSAALELYRESIKIYPGYVAGYRGLGLGYEAAGNTDEALKAFHTYVRTVPGAVDTVLIKRRIDRLEAARSK